MATIRERVKADGTPIFHVQVRMSGFPARTGSFPTRRQAERWAKTIEAEMIEGRHFRGVEARRRKVADAIDRYVLEEVPKKRNGSMYAFTLPWWKTNIGHLKLSEVTPAVLVEYRGKLGRETYTRSKPQSKHSSVRGEEPRQFKRSAATVNRYLANLSHVFTVARKEWHWMSHNPFDAVSKLGESNGRVRFLSEEERERLLTQTAQDPQLHTLVVLALATASRAGELVNLRWHDIEIEKSPSPAPEGKPVETARVLLRQTKNAEPRAVWLHGEALKLLKEHRARRPADDDRVFSSIRGKRYDYREPFEVAREAAKVSNFKFHDLRHSSATYLARAGATEQQLKAIGGWKSNVVSRYVHLAAEDAKAVLEKMNNKILRLKPENGSSGES